jgi:hypothetical protein
MSPLAHIEETFHSIFQETGKITVQTSSSRTYQSQCQTISWQTAVSSPTFTPSPIKERSQNTMLDWSTLQNKQFCMCRTRLCGSKK